MGLLLVFLGSVLEPWGSLLEPWDLPFEGQVIFGNIFRAKCQLVNVTHLLGSVFERVLEGLTVIEILVFFEPCFWLEKLDFLRIVLSPARNHYF